MDYNKLFKDIAEYRIMKAEIEKTLDALESQVKEAMQAEGKTEVLGEEHKATYKEVVSNRFDSTAFKADHKDMYEAYKKPSTSMRFTFA